MKKVTKKAFEKVQERLSVAEAKHRHALNGIGQEGNDQDGWHGEMFQMYIIDEMKCKSDIVAIKKLLSEIEVIDYMPSGNVIEVGVIVDVLIGDDFKKFVFDGVPYDNDIPVITNESPIGAALFGKKKGDIVRYLVGNKEMEVTIKNIVAF